MNCPHCGKVVIVKLVKDDGKQPEVIATAGGPTLRQMLSDIDDSKLDGQAADFVAQTRERFAKYKDSTRMSDKQLKIAYGESEEEAWS